MVENNRQLLIILVFKYNCAVIIYYDYDCSNETRHILLSIIIIIVIKN